MNTKEELHKRIWDRIGKELGWDSIEPEEFVTPERIFGWTERIIDISIDEILRG